MCKRLLGIGLLQVGVELGVLRSIFCLLPLKFVFESRLQDDGKCLVTLLTFYLLDQVAQSRLGHLVCADHMLRRLLEAKQLSSLLESL